jgi:hypothetical protein
VKWPSREAAPNSGDERLKMHGPVLAVLETAGWRGTSLITGDRFTRRAETCAETIP